MVSKKTQIKAGVPARRRGQQMGDERSGPDKTKAAKEQTPATSGRRPASSEFFADESKQAVGGDNVTPSTVAPSTPAALPTGEKLGESGGEREFKQRQRAAAGRSRKKD